MNRMTIGITMGDAAGIGPEITVKSLAVKEVYEKCIPVVIGDCEPMRDALAFCHSDLKLNIIENVNDAKGEFGTIDLIDMKFLPPGSWEYKKPRTICGDACFHYITYAIKLAMDHAIGAVVTAPINKEALHMAGHNYAGHTEIFAEYTHTPKYGMMLASGPLRVIHVSTHVSLREACDRVKKDRVLGHIPLKLSGFKLDPVTNAYTNMSGINCTIGLPVIRSSVDHGTAYDKAGEGRANEESMLDAIFAGIQMSKTKFGTK
jgi:4-hydroxythreonine-4-phosphate dehydrogenase